MNGELLTLDTLYNVLSTIGLSVAGGLNPVMVGITISIMNISKSQWSSFTSHFSDFNLSLTLSLIFFFAAHWIHGGAYLLLDVTKQPAFLYKYKLQAKKVFDTALIPKLFKSLLLGQVFVMVPYMMILKAANTVRIERHTMPSPGEFGRDLLIMVLCTELAFYTSHYLLHLPYFYQRFHKIHHEYTSPIALVSTYAHPVEFFLGNVFSNTLGALLVRPHLFTWYVWIIYTTIGTQVHHSGYRFPWHILDHEPDFHDYHHETFTTNYGLLGILDRIFGTDKDYRIYLSKKGKEKKL